MNTLGNLGGMVGPLVVGFAAERLGSWTFAFYVTAAVYAAGAIAWFAIDPTSPIGIGKENLEFQIPNS
jgi:nitrate/nitrite transporter NarK